MAKTGETKSAIDVRLSTRGTITLPKAFRKKHRLHEVAFLTLIDVGGGDFLLTTSVSQASETHKEWARELVEDGLTLDTMRVLDEEREKYYREHYLEPKDLPG